MKGMPKGQSAGNGINHRTELLISGLSVGGQMTWALRRHLRRHLARRRDERLGRLVAGRPHRRVVIAALAVREGLEAFEDHD